MKAETICVLVLTFIIPKVFSQKGKKLTGVHSYWSSKLGFASPFSLPGAKPWKDH